MKKSHITLFVLAALIAGGGSGFIAARWQYRVSCGKSIAEVLTTDEFVRTASAFDALRDLRGGETNSVVDDLERELDVGVVYFTTILPESPPERAQKYRNMLHRIRDYRAKFPRHTEDAEMDRQVSTALADATKETRQ